MHKQELKHEFTRTKQTKLKLSNQAVKTTKHTSTDQLFMFIYFLFFLAGEYQFKLDEILILIF
jgi:hypothetical protein